MKEILIINGHPNPESFNHALAESYTNGAKQAQAKLDQIDIGQLDFNPNLQYGYQQKTPLEPDLLEAIEKIKRADHLVWFFPIWWHGQPAIMKGFIDRTFLPNITFKYNNSPLPEKLLKGKTARLVITADSPRWYNHLIIGNPAINQLKRGTLQFCGVNPVRVSYIGPVRSSSVAYREKWLEKIHHLGQKMR